jgi:hypothetical protein
MQGSTVLTRRALAGIVASLAATTLAALYANASEGTPKTVMGRFAAPGRKRGPRQ